MSDPRVALLQLASAMTEQGLFHSENQVLEFLSSAIDKLYPMITLKLEEPIPLTWDHYDGWGS